MPNRQRSETTDQIEDLVRTARASLGLTMSFLSRWEDGMQHTLAADSDVPAIAAQLQSLVMPTKDTLCSAVLDGRLPAVTPDLGLYPEVMAAAGPATQILGSYISVPITLSDGTFYGTFCAAGLGPSEELSPRDEALMSVLAHAASVIIEPGVRVQQEEDEILSRLTPLAASGGPRVVVQPIVDLSSGMMVGVEALSRFPFEWDKAPDVCFAEAHRVGLGGQFELLALEGAAAHLAELPGYVAMNVSPSTLLTPEFSELMGRLPLRRVLLELSEHDQVEDYDQLTAVLAPLRAAGMRLAIDDVGSGFSSLRHIVLTAPDVIKLDRSIVTGAATDMVLATLVKSLVDFAAGMSAKVVAEGVETAEDAEKLRSLGVDYGQGWHFGRPASPADLRDRFEPVIPLQRSPQGTLSHL